MTRPRVLLSGTLLALATVLALARPSAQTEQPNPTPPFNVNVVNEPSFKLIPPIEPLPVQVPEFEPFQVEHRFTLARGEGAGEGALSLEDGGNIGQEGQHVVIEHVTLAASIPVGQNVIAYIKIGEMKHALVLTPQGTWGSSQILRASQPIKLYSSGGGVGVGWGGVQRSSTTGTASFYFTASGYVMK